MGIFRRKIKFITIEYHHIFKSIKDANYIYGWIDGYGTPPNLYKDVLMITNKKPNLGDSITGKIVGIFYRCDGDHKLFVLSQKDLIKIC